MYRTIIALTLLYSSLTLTYRQNDYIIKHDFAKIEYYNNSIVEYVTLRNVKPNRTYRAYTISWRSYDDWDGDAFKCNIKAFKFVNNQYQHKIVDYDVKVCRALEANYMGVAENLKGAKLDKCPIKKGYYTIDNFNLDDRKLPPFVPGGRYKFQLTGLKKGYTIVKASVYGEIIYKNKQ